MQNYPPQQPEDPIEEAVLEQDQLNFGLGTLPGPNSRPARAPALQELGAPPDHIDANYLEFSTSQSARGLQLFSGGVTLVLLPCLTWLTIEQCFSGLDPHMSVFMLAICIFILVVGIGTFRGALERPLSEPIRFNRSRQRVYIYRLKRNFNPFSRTGWKASPVDFPWQSLRARKGRSRYVDYVCFEAIGSSSTWMRESFYLSRHNGSEGVAKWMLARIFMQHGIEALPEFNDSPSTKDPNGPTGLISELVPKVRWPAKIDVVSRTAKDQDPESLVPAPANDAQLQRELVQLKRFRRLFFTRGALGLSGAWVALAAIIYSPGLLRDATMALAWLQGAEPQTFESPESLLARRPGPGWQVSLHGHGRCSITAPGTSVTAATLPSINCNAILWGRPAYDTAPLDVGGVLIHVRRWQWPSEWPRPKAWPSSERWPPSQLPDAAGRWQQIEILAGEPGKFTINGLVVAQTIRGKDGQLTELTIDASQEITAQWKPAVRLIVLFAAAIALALAIWWPPELQRRLCGGG